MSHSQHSQIPTAMAAPAVHSVRMTANNNALDTPAAVSLTAKLAGDAMVAAGVTFCISPFLTIVDKAIVQAAAGSHTVLRSSMESAQGMLRHPISFVRSPTNLMMWAVMAATYTTANSLKTITEHTGYQQVKTSENTDSKMKTDGYGKGGVFLGTFIVYSGASLVKDKAYARIFGTGSVARKVPRMTYALWMARDLGVIGSSFILPDIVSSHLVEKYDMNEAAAKDFCQLALPIATPLVAGPLHYMGLDLYNRNLASKSWMEAIIDRSQSLYQKVAPVVVARIARIAPGYGIGGVFNTHLRDSWRNYLVEQEAANHSHSATSLAMPPRKKTVFVISFNAI